LESRTRREEELHGSEDGAEEAEHFGCGGGVAVEEAFDEAGKDGGDHAEGEHVEGDGEEDEGGGGAAAFGRFGRAGGVYSIARADEFGLGHQRVGWGDRLVRIFGRVWHVRHVCKADWR
jgi:hypothetical protein